MYSPFDVMNYSILVGIVNTLFEIKYICKQWWCVLGFGYQTLENTMNTITLQDLFKTLDGNPAAQAALVDLCDAYSDCTDGLGAMDIQGNTGVTDDRADDMVTLCTQACDVIRMADK